MEANGLENERTKEFAEERRNAAREVFWEYVDRQVMLGGILARREGREEGRRIAWREAIRGVLEARFDTTELGGGLVDALESIDEPARLQRLLGIAVRCASVEKFHDELQD